MQKPPSLLCLALPSLPDFYDRADFISQASSFLLLLTTWGFLSCQDDEDIKSDKSFASLCLCVLAALATCVRALHFIWWIKAKYRPSTHQELWLNKVGSRKWQLLEKNKCYKVSWGGKTQSSTIILSVERLKAKSTLSPYFVTFCEREPVLRGGSCVGILGVFGPKGALGSPMWKKFQKFGRLLCGLARE